MIDEEGSEALEAGCDAYILKPVNRRRLADQVASVVENLTWREASNESTHCG
jgi:YesN/AraC family two-component response regulator